MPPVQENPHGVKRMNKTYEAILFHELVPALGCTEPIAIAFAAARARAVLGKEPTQIKVYCSGNIIKNVKSVIVPNSGGRRGIEMAAVLGCVGGNADLNYEVLSNVSEKEVQKAVELLKNNICKTFYQEGKDNLYIRVEEMTETDSASVTVEHEHTNIVQIIHNGAVLSEKAESNISDVQEPGKSALNVKDIIRYAETTALVGLRELLKRQIDMNSRISEEGLKGCFGAEVGKLLMQMEGDHVEGRAAARAAAGSDARMNGCSLPVVINSGSGNQGMTIALPVCEYAQHWKRDEDTLLRALIIANLISVHIKHHIGNLSAFCGAVSAACGAACGIAWMDGWMLLR